jgi:hypothetical protein
MITNLIKIEKYNKTSLTNEFQLVIEIVINKYLS